MYICHIPKLIIKMHSSFYDNLFVSIPVKLRKNNNINKTYKIILLSGMIFFNVYCFAAMVLLRI